MVLSDVLEAVKTGEMDQNCASDISRKLIDRLDVNRVEAECLEKSLKTCLVTEKEFRQSQLDIGS